MTAAATRIPLWLVFYLLERKKLGLPVSCGHIVEKELYGDGATPWNILSEDEPWMDFGDALKKIFVITKNSELIGMSKNNRVAGCGAWIQTASIRTIKDPQGEMIGKKRIWSFNPRKDFESDFKGKGLWIMDEILFQGYNNHAVCVITKILPKQKEEATMVVKRKFAGEDDPARTAKSCSWAPQNFLYA